MNQLALFTDEQSPRSGAELSPCGRYRFVLWRSWANAGVPGHAVNFVMLNPSTADASADDPTIRRCIGYAKRWGYGGLIVTNLCPFRATDPSEIRHWETAANWAAVQNENDFHVERWTRGADLVVCGWGNLGFGGRAARAMALIREAGRVPHCLAMTSRGAPSHPLYLRSDLKPIPMP